MLDTEQSPLFDTMDLWEHILDQDSSSVAYQWKPCGQREYASEAMDDQSEACTTVRPLFTDFVVLKGKEDFYDVNEDCKEL